MGKCIKCGTNFVGTPEHPQADALCKYCEIEYLKSDNAKLRKALVGLVGADTLSELDGMEALIRISPVSDEDRMNTINAIHALRGGVPGAPGLTSEANAAPLPRSDLCYHPSTRTAQGAIVCNICGETLAP